MGLLKVPQYGIVIVLNTAITSKSVNDLVPITIQYCNIALYMFAVPWYFDCILHGRNEKSERSIESGGEG